MTKILGSLLSLLVGMVFMLIGFVNLFWGNDPFFGLGIVLFSGLYFMPVLQWIQSVNPQYWRIGLVVLGVLIVWAALGVGELEDKIELMQASFPMPNITGI